MIGRTLGHYRIVEKIGAGAMGEVYRAHDERLDRDVALKVLPAGTLDDASRRRFRREALALSRLSHPNIETVFDFDTQDGIDLLVMEYVAGQTLGHLLAEREMTEKEVMKIGVQLAMALEEAHEKGVVHRDLKPSNVVVTPRGQVKVLDFGLAELLETGDPAQASTKTVTAPAGTLRYMAPEVLQGRPADPRSDIWSLGVVLYEMACRRPPFQGSSAYELTAAIVRAEPEGLPPRIAPPLRMVIANCLARAPEQRYQRPGEVRASLEALLSDSSVGMMTTVPEARRRRWLLMAAGAVVLVAITILAAIWVQRPPAPAAGFELANGQLSLLLSTEGELQFPHLASDGKTIVYVSQEGATFDLYVSRIAGGGRVRVTTDGEMKAYPSFSPDGERISFTRMRRGSDTPEICVVPSLGGEPTPLVAGAAAVWSPDGRQLAYLQTPPGAPVSLATVSTDGADPRVLLKGDDVYPFLRDPAWSPDGSQIAVVRSHGGVAGEIWIVRAAGGSPRKLSQDPFTIFSHEPAFTPDGRAIVHASNRSGATNLWLTPLDGGAPVRLTSGPGPDEHPSVASDNTIAFLCSRWRSEIRLQPVGGPQDPRSITTHGQYLWGPAFSPDGREISFSRFETDGMWHIWVTSVDGGGPVRQITSGASGEIYSRFAPDGSVVYHSRKDSSIHAVPRSGGVPRQLTSGGDDQWPDVSPDGHQLAFVRTEGDTTRVYIAPMTGGPPRLLTTSRATLPRWSPDGKLIVFSSGRDVRAGVFIIGADGRGERRLTDTGSWPVWWPDGRRVAYLRVGPDGTQQLWSVPAQGGDSWHEAWVQWKGDNNPIDISPDGRWLVTSDGKHLTDEIWLLRPASTNPTAR
jgi:Tol biopolymer transport system component/predicted Ser/Thr protein kinase